MVYGDVMALERDKSHSLTKDYGKKEDITENLC